MGKEQKKIQTLLRMCLNLYDYKAKASRYRKGLIYLKNKATTNQNHTIYLQRLKRRGHKHQIKRNHPTNERKEQKRNIESPGKQGLKWQ